MTQTKILPTGSRVTATREWPGFEHDGLVYGRVPVGATGEVIGHTDDGRARIVFDGQVHTFDDVDSFAVESIADQAFANLVTYCASVPELVEQFNRLSGCNLGQSANRTPFERAIDEATGAPGESEIDMALFVEFVREYIWMRLPQVTTPTPGADI